MRTRAIETATTSAKIDAGITSLTDLAAITTSGLATTPPSIRIFVNSDTGMLEVWRLIASTEATVSGSVQRPTDYNESTNAKVWFKAGS